MDTLDEVDKRIFILFYKLCLLKHYTIDEYSLIYQKYKTEIPLQPITQEYKCEVEEGYAIKEEIESMPKISEFPIIPCKRPFDDNFLNFKNNIRKIQNDQCVDSFIKDYLPSFTLELISRPDDYKPTYEAFLKEKNELEEKERADASIFDPSKIYRPPIRHLGMKKSEWISLSIVIIVPLLLILITIIISKQRIRMKYKKDVANSNFY